ncbi:protein of unknown function [Prauserella marina]|uniref:Uncharacterized protein n=1 Tax=Prauserella marina TaxID=530584 RepID=A0A1G6JNS8_9PSEU|nr:DUF4352 domain-containing protein [Prauserella marina]PWV84519.1 uncharacterized protein DUF4352 [Prauserella marina]SDC20328.1 protein of unknown function [Prauserella marina]
MIIGGVAAALIVISVVTTSPESTPEDTAAPAAEAQQAADTESAATIGQPARDGKFEFVVKDLSRAKTVGDYLTATAQGEYVIVELTVKNIGSEPQLLSDTEQFLYDARGNKYSADSAAGIYLTGDGSDSVWFKEINPGNTVEGKIAFDLPADVEPVSAELHDSSLSGGVTVDLT